VQVQRGPEVAGDRVPEPVEVLGEERLIEAKRAVALVEQRAYEIPIAFTPQLLAYNPKVKGLSSTDSICDAPDLRGVTL
jgi:hypothetical protein